MVLSRGVCAAVRHRLARLTYPRARRSISNGLNCCKHGNLSGEPVAQVVEHVTFNHRVPGSSPGRLTKSYLKNSDSCQCGVSSAIFSASDFGFR